MGTIVQSVTHHGSSARAILEKANYGKGRAGNPETTLPSYLSKASINIDIYINPFL